MTHVDDLGSLLPHGPGMVFLRRILSVEDDAIECEVVPGDGDRAFRRGDAIPSAVALEYMAQAIALFVSEKLGSDRRPGVVIAVRRFEVRAPALALGRPLVVRVERRWGETEVARFDGTLRDGDEVVASGAISVFRPTEGSIDGF